MPDSPTRHKEPTPRMERFSERLRERGVNCIALPSYVLILEDVTGRCWEHQVPRGLIEHASADSLPQIEREIVNGVQFLRRGL